MTATSVHELAMLRRRPPEPLRYWRTHEDAILRAHYPVGGMPACAPLLPERSPSAIYCRAAMLRLTAPPMTRPRTRRYAIAEHIDAAITRLYQGEAVSGSVQALADELARPRWWITKRAVTLGLVAPRFREREWTPAEDDLLCELFDRGHTVKVIVKKMRAAGHPRTEAAVANRHKRLGGRRKERSDGLTACQLATLMGVNGRTVTRWIEVEGLPAVKRGTERTAAQGGDMWLIKLRALRGWIGEHAQLVDLRKCDRYWMIDLLLGRLG